MPSSITHFKLRVEGDTWPADTENAIFSLALAKDFSDAIDAPPQLTINMFDNGLNYVGGEPLVFLEDFGYPIMGGVNRVAPFSVEYVFLVGASYSDPAYEDLYPEINNLLVSRIATSPTLTLTLFNSTNGVTFHEVGTGPVGGGTYIVPLAGWEGEPAIPVFWRDFVKTREV